MHTRACLRFMGWYEYFIRLTSKPSALESIPEQYWNTSVSNSWGGFAIKIVYYGDKPQNITSYLSHSLKDIIIGYDVQQYWLRKGKWEEINDERVDSSAFKHVLSNMPQHKRLWLAKWNSRFCSVGKNLSRWRDQTHSICHRCSAT